MEIHSGRGLGSLLTHRKQIPAEQDWASVRLPQLGDQQSLWVTLGEFLDNCFIANVGEKMENKTKFCCILKVSWEERIVSCGGKNSELNQK